MNTCATTRFLVPATLIAVLVASLTNSDGAAFAAGVVTAVVIWAFQRFSGRAATTSCTLEPTTPAPTESRPRSDPHPSDAT